MHEQSGRQDGVPPAQELTSALADGELAGADLQRALEQLRADETERARWRDYHVIGEALREVVVLSGCGEDAAFVLRLRQRLVAAAGGEPTGHAGIAPPV
ncbi:MAG: sigma-E factor negative regulatory protein [Hylemonella sp.]